MAEFNKDIREIVFGIDFGTTNSLVSYVSSLGDATISLKDIQKDVPHPSMVLYRGDEVITGCTAKEQADLLEGTSHELVKSPKRYLGREEEWPLPGRNLSNISVVSEVLKMLKDDALHRRAVKQDIKKAVFTVPVSFDGKSREDLRKAAKLANIDVAYFVHEPLAALYSFIRNNRDFVNGIHEYNNKFILVFDWGGGTLDLTLCQVKGTTLHQIRNVGDDNIGGDEFDIAIKQFISGKHASDNGINAFQQYETTESKNALLQNCEGLKKNLSIKDDDDFILENYLTGDNLNERSKNLFALMTRVELEEITSHYVERGINLIYDLLKSVGLEPHSIEFCLPTGGMVNMPSIRNKLDQIFPGRVANVKNGNTIISEGAAEIAYDMSIPVFSKPIEILDSNNSPYEIAQSGQPLPIFGKSQTLTHSNFYCTDPRDGYVTFQFQCPKSLGRKTSLKPRRTLGKLQLEIDSNANPNIERINLNVLIDENYIVKCTAHSTGANKSNSLEIHELEFSLKIKNVIEENLENEIEGEDEINTEVGNNENNFPTARGLVFDENDDSLDKESRIAGDIVSNYYPNHMSKYNPRATERQHQEYIYYTNCSICGTSSYEGCNCNFQ